MVLPWLLYSATLSAGFVWDDHNLIEMRPPRPSLAELRAMWGADFWQTASSRSQYYRPLTTTSFWLDRALFGLNPRGYHFTNVLLYSLTCGAAYLLLYRLLKKPLTALLLGLAFAAQPAHTENVAWISGRTDIVCALFMFASLLAYFTAEEEERPGLLVGAVALFFLSLLGKEMSLPLIAVIGIDQLRRRGPSPAAALRLAPFLAAAALFWLLHSSAAGGSGIENLYHTPGAKFLNVARNLALGVWFSLAPGGFHLLVAATREEAGKLFVIPGGLRLAALLLPLAAALGGTALAAWKRKDLLFLALASGLLSLLPISGVIPIGVVFAIRFLLIPSFFFFLAAGALLAPVAERKVLTVPLPVLILVPVIALYAAFTFLRAPAWRSDVTLMESALEKDPDAALGHFLLGNGLASQGRDDEAMAHYLRAVELRPQYPDAYYNLGALEEREGRLQAAEASYRRSLASNPDYGPARMALMRLSQRSGRMPR